MARTKKETILTEVVNTFDIFWKGIVCDAQGRLNKDKVMKELYDFKQLMEAASKVYYHVTDGMISNTNTDPDSVIAIADDKEQERLDSYMSELEEADKEAAEDVFHVTLNTLANLPVRRATVTLPINVPVGQVHEVFYDVDSKQLVDRTSIPEGWVEDAEDALRFLVEGK